MLTARLGASDRTNIKTRRGGNARFTERHGRILRDRHRDRSRVCGRPHANRRVERADGAQQVQLLHFQPLPDVRNPVQREDFRDFPLLDFRGVLLSHAGRTGVPDPQSAVLPHEGRGRDHRRTQLALPQLEQYRPADCHIHSRKSRAGRSDSGHAAGDFHPGGTDRAGCDHQGRGVHETHSVAAAAPAAAHRVAGWHHRLGDHRENRAFHHP